MSDSPRMDEAWEAPQLSENGYSSKIALRDVAFNVYHVGCKIERELKEANAIIAALRAEQSKSVETMTNMACDLEEAKDNSKMLAEALFPFSGLNPLSKRVKALWPSFVARAVKALENHYLQYPKQ
jgi:hypothetical protein